ncbi:MAG: hypothetical protein GX606_07305, partial [Elusimicrobia bacterium]|nr:hypothetical protein [Elusimicrobiota bacterium]
MKKTFFSKRVLAYLGLIVLYAVAVKVQQEHVMTGRQARIISTIEEWRQNGKPVEVRPIAVEDVKQYLKVTVQATPEDLVYEGFVSRDIQQKLSPGQDLYWIRQEGRLEVGAPVAGTVLFVG